MRPHTEVNVNQEDKTMSVSEQPRISGHSRSNVLAYLALFLAALCTKRQSDLFPSALMFSC